MKSSKLDTGASPFEAIFFYTALLFLSTALITSCSISKHVKKDDIKTIEKITPSFYTNLFFSGIRIDSIDKIMSRIYANDKPNVDTSEGGAWSEYGRWRSFWVQREGRPGQKKTGPEPYLSALSELAIEDFCNVVATPGTPATWKQLGPFEGPLTSGVPQQSLGAVFAIAADPNDLNTVYVGTGSGGLWKTTNALAPTPVWKNQTDNLKLPSLGISDIVIDPGNNQIIYAAASNPRHGYGVGVIKSINGGANWNVTDLTFDPIHPFPINQLLIDPNNPNIVYAQTDKEIFRSSNGGSSWPDMGFQVASSNPTIGIRSMEFNLTDPNIIYLSGNAIWKAAGNTSQWTQLNTLSSFTAPVFSGFTFDSFVSAELSGVNGGCYALIEWRYINNINLEPTTKIEIKKYSEATNSWQSIANTTYFNKIFIVNPDDPAIMYIGQSNGTILKSKNSGNSFTSVSEYWPDNIFNGVSTHADIRTMKLINPSLGGVNDVLLVGNDGGALLATSTNTSNYPVTWKNINGKGLAISEFFGISINEFDPYLIYAGAQDNGLSSFDNYNWNTDVMADGYDCLVDVDNEAHAYGQINYPDIRKTTNRGQNWSSNSIPLPPYKNPLCTLSSCYFNPDDWYKVTKWPLFYDANKTLYIGRFDLFRKNGNAWMAISNFSVPPFSIVSDNLIAAAIAKSDANIIYVAFSNGGFEKPLFDANGQIITSAKQHRLLKTIDGGLNWTGITPDPAQWFSITDIILDPNNPNRVWVSFNGSETGTGDGRRVNFSGDGGSTWQDCSIGLKQEFPVHTLTYQEGSNDFIYAGTDVGIFYHDGPDMTTPWHCYNEGMPVTPVYDLEISICAEKIRAATFGRGLWESDLAAQVSNWGDEIITGNITYSGKKLINKNIIVESGASLTVDNTAILNIYPDRKIIIKPGGLMTIDGGVLTNNCRKLWSGIEVWGTAASASISQQGRLEVKNNATISFAREAVRLWKPGDYNSPGGVIIARNSNFINNRRSVEFIQYAYGYQNRGFFENCKFTVDDEYPVSAPKPWPMVTLWSVKGVEFLGCQFVCSNSNYLDKFNGIYSIDADYIISSFCDPMLPLCTKVPCVFKDLSHAVEANGSIGTVEVWDAQFISNNVGLSLHNIVGAKIIKNTFEIGNVTGLIMGLGAALGACTKFLIEDNTFKRYSISSNPFCGLAISDSGGDVPFPIYNNTFDHLSIGTYVYGLNSVFSGCPFGLQYHCNHNSSNDVDFYVGGSIQKSQGLNVLPAGNTFSIGGSFNLLANSSCNIDYYFANSGTNESPASISGPITLIGTSSMSDCVSHFPDAGGNSGLVGKQEWPAIFRRMKTSFDQSLLIGNKLKNGQISKTKQNELLVNYTAKTKSANADFFLLQQSITKDISLTEEERFGYKKQLYLSAQSNELKFRFFIDLIFREHYTDAKNILTGKSEELILNFVSSEETKQILELIQVIEKFGRYYPDFESADMERLKPIEAIYLYPAGYYSKCLAASILFRYDSKQYSSNALNTMLEKARQQIVKPK